MRNLMGLTFGIVLAVSTAQVFALGQNQATYAIGTVQAVKVGTAGTVDLASASELVFHSSAGQFAIPYAQVVSYTWRAELKKPLGVLPMIALALVVWPPKTYYVTVTWHGDQNIAEVATFEVSKLESQGLEALFKARAAGACKSKGGQICGQQW